MHYAARRAGAGNGAAAQLELRLGGASGWAASVTVPVRSWDVPGSPAAAPPPSREPRRRTFVGRQVAEYASVMEALSRAH